MGYYVMRSKVVICPKWGEKIVISAKYRLIPPYERIQSLASFSCSECEILNNIHKPEHLKDERLSLCRYCDMDNCPHLDDFPAQITLP